MEVSRGKHASKRWKVCTNFSGIVIITRGRGCGLVPTAQPRLVHPGLGESAEWRVQCGALGPEGVKGRECMPLFLEGGREKGVYLR